MLIVYCEGCGFRVPEDEVTSGQAVRLDENKYYCAKCVVAKKSPAAARISSRNTPDGNPTLRPAREEKPTPVKGATHQHVIPPAAHARATSAAGKSTSKKNDFTLIVAGGSGALVLLLVGIFAFGGKKDTKSAARSVEKPGSSASDSKAVAVTPAKPVSPVAATHAGITPAMISPAKTLETQQDRQREMDKEMAERMNARAAKLLDDHKVWYQAHAEDVWGYKERLSVFAGTYRSTPSAAEAAKLLAELKIAGEPSPDSVIWHRAWDITRGVQAVMNESHDGRRHILETHPQEGDKPAVLARKVKVPADKPFFEFSIRNHDQGDFKLILAADGKTLLSEDINRRQWMTFTLDMTPAAGREVELSFQHHNTGWHHEHAYWTAPRFVAAASPGARVIALGGVTEAAIVTSVPPVQPTVGDSGGWRALFDGLTLGCLGRGSHAEWKVENGALVSVAPKRTGGQTAQEFTDGELRIRFETTGAQFAQFTARQGEAGGYTFKLDRSNLITWNGKPQELLIAMRGEDVSGTLNGQPVRPEPGGKPRSGRLQMTVHEGGMRITALDYREVATAPAAPVVAERAWGAFCRLAMDEIFPRAPTEWREENGALASSAGGSFQSKRDMEDGELRIRFETQNVTWAEFALRQGEQPGYSVGLSKGRLDALGGKPGEVVFTARGEQVSATLNGQPLEVDPGGKMKRGKVHVYNANGAMKILSLEFRELGAVTPPLGAPGVLRPATEPAVVGTMAPDASALYEAVQSDVYALLAKNGLTQAQARLQTAKADAKLSTLLGLLERDAKLIRLYEGLHPAMVKGAAALLDKRPFSLRRTDGKDLTVGKGGSGAVLEIKDDAIQLEQSIGGGKAIMRVPLDQLTPQTRFELAKMGSSGAEGELRLAMALLVMLNAGGDVSPKAIRLHLDAAKKENTEAELIAQIVSRLDARDRELAAEQSFKKLDVLAKEKKWAELKTAIENYRREFGGTLAHGKVQGVLEQRLADAAEGLNPVRAGLWASYWGTDGDNWFKTMYFARAEQKLCYDWGDGKCDERVPENDFAIKWVGKIRIDREGTYRFKGWADDRMSLFLDGKKLMDHNQEQELVLTKGEHDFKMTFREYVAGARVGLQWRYNNAGDFVEIPGNLFSYDPRQVEKYQKE